MVLHPFAFFWGEAESAQQINSADHSFFARALMPGLESLEAHASQRGGQCTKDTECIDACLETRAAFASLSH